MSEALAPFSSNEFLQPPAVDLPGLCGWLRSAAYAAELVEPTAAESAHIKVYDDLVAFIRVHGGVVDFRLYMRLDARFTPVERALMACELNARWVLIRAVPQVDEPGLCYQCELQYRHGGLTRRTFLGAFRRFITVAQLAHQTVDHLDLSEWMPESEA